MMVVDFIRPATVGTRTAVLTLLLVCWTIVVSASVSGAPRSTSSGRTQEVSLSAPWPTSCLYPLAEGAEFIAEGSHREFFWKYVDVLGNSPQWVFSCTNSTAVADELGATSAASLAARMATGGGEVVPDFTERIVTHVIMAAGQGFDEGTVGVELDDLSLRLMELALSARYHNREPFEWHITGNARGRRSLFVAERHPEQLFHQSLLFRDAYIS